MPNDADADLEELTCDDLRELSDWLFDDADRRRQISNNTADDEREIAGREALAKKLKQMMIARGCS